MRQKNILHYERYSIEVKFFNDLIENKPLVTMRH